MKKLKLLLAFCALLLGWSNASATDWVGNEVAAGEFYLYNVGADRYLGFGENWGTKATADHAGIPVTLVAGSGTYTIKTNVASSGNKLFVDGYMDGGAGKSGDWVFTDQNVAGKKVYTINIGEKYLYYDGSTIAVGNNPNSANGQWQLVTKAQRDAAFVAKNGSQSAPLDITYKYIQNPNTTYFTNVYSTSNSWTAESNAWDIKGANKDWWDGKDNNAEVWNKNFNNYMTMEDVPNGVYEFGVLGFYRDGGSETAIEHYAAGSFVGNAKIYANTDETTLQSIVTGYNSAEIYGGNDKSKTVDGVTYYIPNSQLGAALYFIRNKYNWQTVRTVVTNNTLTIGVKKSTTIGDDWTIVDKFYLSYLGVDLSSLQTTFENARNALNEFAGNIPTSYAATVSSVKAKYKDVESYSTEDEYNAAILELNTTLSTATAMVSSYAAFNALKAKANTLQAVANTNAEANNTLATAITTQTDAAEAATTASAIETATSTLKTAMITYVGAADPTSGNRFDLTFMITTPDMTDLWTGAWNVVPAGWATEQTGGNFQVMQNNVADAEDGIHKVFTEYYYLTNNNTTWGNNKFNVYTTVEDLPVGTYTMSCYAFAKEQNYSSGDPVPAVYFYANETQGSLVDNARLTEKSISFINEEQQNVKIGLKPLTGNTYNWMGIGYVELYKEYTDNTTYGINVGSVSNATVAVTVDGEAATSAKALKTVTMTFTPEAGYAVSSVTATYNDGEEKAIDVANPSENVYTFQMPAYDVSVAAAVVVDKRALATAISSASGARKTANEGTGAFQIPAAAGTTLAGAITDAQNVYNNGAATVSDVTTAISTLNTAVETYEATTLNAPDAEKHYNIIVATAEHAKNGNAVVESLGATGVNNPTGYSFNASAAPNVNLAQAVKFTQVSGNNYNISFETSEGVVYLTYGALNGSAANWKNSQIQGTTDSAKKGEFKIAATATANVFNIYNTITNSTIACQTGGSLYTEAGNADFTIAEASQATVDITISSAVKYATRIFPFTPTTWPNGVVAYSCEETEDNVLTLEKVDVPVANTPYILYAEGGSTGSVSGWGTAPSTDAKKVGLLTGVYANTSAPVNSYVLQNNNDKVGFYKVAADHEPTVGAYRCYLTDGENARAAFFFRGDITGVANVEAATEATLKDGKYLENGKIVIVKNGVKYNAAGAQVK